MVVAAAATRSLLEGPAESWYEHAFGTAALVAGPVATAVGPAVWSRHRRNGDVLVALGVLPGCAAIVLFWHPLFPGFGLASIAVLVAAVNDAERVNRIANAPDVVARS